MTCSQGGVISGSLVTGPWFFSQGDHTCCCAGGGGGFPVRPAAGGTPSQACSGGGRYPLARSVARRVGVPLDKTGRGTGTTSDQGQNLAQNLE